MTKQLKNYLAELSKPEHINSLTNFGRGIEREALRVCYNASKSSLCLSESPHSYTLGSALTHPLITTDYAENLLEFITPVCLSPEQAIAKLQDIQKFTLEKLNDELLWPFSMPCKIDNEDSIPLAHYGTSNIGQMKHVYRKGLKNRYGSSMQIISGIHFNFSFSQDFWRSMQVINNNNDKLADFISERYFLLIRNYKKYCWLIPYLFGSSPAIDDSFLKNNNSSFTFNECANNTKYLEFATSLRMSDLGYTSSSQSSLTINYNSLNEYIKSVGEALNLPCKNFENIGVKVSNQYQQLNANILQIENELYATIRPKRVAKVGEKPSHALKNAGVEYIEIRALDVNPFVETGISIEQIYFLDVFLTFCALTPNESIESETQKTYDDNLNAVVINGRNPQINLLDGKLKKSIKDWGKEIFSQLLDVANLLDKANSTLKYSQAINNELEKILDVNLTPSAKIISLITNENENLTELAIKSAKEFKSQTQARKYQYYNAEYFNNGVKKSHEDQKIIEKNDDVNFDQYLKEYFST